MRINATDVIGTAIVLAVAVAGGIWIRHRSQPRLQTVTVVAAYWRTKAPVPPGIPLNDAQPEMNVLLQTKEWIQGQDYKQLSLFLQDASRSFVLTAPGQPDIHVMLDGWNFSADGTGWQAFGGEVRPADIATMKPGIQYSLRPENTNDVYKWVVPPGVVLSKAGAT